MKPRKARLLHALACARCAGMEARVKNHSDELIFHSQGLRRSAANLVRSHRRIRNFKVHIRQTLKCEILLACLSAKRFDMEVRVKIMLAQRSSKINAQKRMFALIEAAHSAST